MNLIKDNISEKKLEIIFNRLDIFIKQEVINYKQLYPLIKKFKLLLNSKFDKNIFCLTLKDIGKECVKDNILYEESLTIIDFLRKNFIAHLPNNIDLRVAKKFERFFFLLEKCFSEGYLLEKIEYDYENFKNFKNFLKEKNLENDLFFYLSKHIDYLLYLFKSLKNGNLEKIENLDCEFSSWLEERKKDLLKEDIKIVNDIEKYHINFHKLVYLIKKSAKRRNLKKTVFLIKDIENNILWMGNKISILNSIILMKKYSRDPLTKLLTRQNLEVIVEKQVDIIKMTENRMSLIFMDIDNFKCINDKYGHVAGDLVLKKIANVIKSSIRKSDYAFRYGGEEFLIVLPFTSKKEAQLVAEKIRKNIENLTIKYNNHLLKTTVSIGVSEYNPKKSLKENLEIVDKKLYKAKKLGKNKVVV